MRFVFLVVFLLPFCWLFIREYLPLFPIPLQSPLSRILTFPPRFSGLAFPLLGSFTFCSVFFLQYGQYLFVVFGFFIIIAFEELVFKVFGCMVP